MKTLFSKQQIHTRVEQLAQQISKDYQKEIYLVGVLKGSYIFLADLVRKIQLPTRVDFIEASSYGNATESSHELQIFRDLRDPIAGKDVILVEDIVDTAHTLNILYQRLASHNPASLKVCSLLYKKEKQIYPIQVDYYGFEIADHFVVGYGMDYAEQYRNLDYVGIYES